MIPSRKINNTNMHILKINQILLEMFFNIEKKRYFR